MADNRAKPAGMPFPAVLALNRILGVLPADLQPFPVRPILAFGRTGNGHFRTGFQFSENW